MLNDELVSPHSNLSPKVFDMLYLDLPDENQANDIHALLQRID
jgi:hypothetical protein